ncbi:retropepsin-like aspartic protease [Ixodes scapularis]
MVARAWISFVDTRAGDTKAELIAAIEATKKHSFPGYGNVPYELFKDVKQEAIDALLQARQPLEVELPKTTDAKILHERRRPPLERYQRPKRRPATVSNNLNVVIDGHDASALVDTGADYSVLSGRLSRRLRKVTTPWDGPQIRTAGGHLITPVGRCTARVEIHGETCPVKFVVLQDCSRDVILGMDFLCEYGAVIDLGETD